MGLADWDAPKKRVTLNQAIDIVLNRLSNDNFTIETIENSIKEVLGYDFDKHRIAIYLNKKGYQYERKKNFWVKSA